MSDKLLEPTPIQQLRAKTDALEAVLISIVAKLNGSSAQKANDLMVDIYNNFLKKEMEDSKNV